MPKKIFRKKVGKSKARGRRRLLPKHLQYKFGQPVRNVGRLAVRAASGVVSAVGQKYNGRRPATARRAQRNFNMRLSGDNVISAPAFKIGTQKKLNFEEKVHRISHPPVTIFRRYAFTAECKQAGRKAWFGMPINSVNQSDALSGTLYNDAITSYQRLTTNTSTADPTLIVGTGNDHQQKIYVDYLSEKLKMVNSGSNSVRGKITLYAYKRDCANLYVSDSVLMTPINLAMYASTGGFVKIQTANEQTVGNGWAFSGGSAATSGTNYTINYNCPGSVMNSGGVCALTDSEFDILDNHISDFTGYFFRKVNQLSFSLKPGQEFSHYTIFNDMPYMRRQSANTAYLAGVTHYLVVEFEGGLIGDSDVLTTNVVSTGCAQLSCIIEEKRIMGTFGKQRTQFVMPTGPLADVPIASQFTINPDTGVADTGYEQAR